jgi:site-specific DNA recombinase
MHMPGTHIVDIYCRVSTDPQEDNTSLDEQEAAGRAFCRDNGFIPGMVHREVFSGYQYREREKLELMRRRYREGKIQGVVVRTLDRLSRSQVHNAILMEEMEHHGVTLHSVKEVIDDTPMGKFVRMILAFVAEMEREKIMDRTMTGRTNAVKNGNLRAVSNHKVRYGFQWEDPATKDKIILNEEEAAVIRWIVEQYASGVGTVRIRGMLQERGIPSPMGAEWSDYTIMSILSDRRITGTGVQAFRYKEKRYKSHHDTVSIPDGTYPAIISTEMFERIQKRMETNKAQATRSSKRPEEFLLRAGYIRCAVCGRGMRGCCDLRRGAFTYRCNNNGHGSIPSKPLDAAIWERIEHMADHVVLIEQAIALATNDNRLERNVHAIEGSIAKWQARAANYLDDLEDDTLTGDSRAAIRKLLNDANKMVMELEAEKAQIAGGLLDKERERAAYREILAWCAQVKEARGELTYQQKRDFMTMLGIQVVVRCQKPYHENSVYDMHVALSALQEIIGVPDGDGGLATSTSGSRSNWHEYC